MRAIYPVFLNFSSQSIRAVSCIIARVMTALIVTVSPGVALEEVGQRRLVFHFPECVAQ